VVSGQFINFDLHHLYMAPPLGMNLFEISKGNCVRKLQ